MKTEALVLAAKDAPFVLQEVELGEPESNEVLVKVVACGLCHTDLCIQNGAFPSPFPTVVGHEGAGIVVSVGSGVTRVSPGDSVLLSFSSCTACAHCKAGHPAGCTTWIEHNFGRHRNAAVKDTPVVTSLSGEPIAATFFGQSTFARHAVVLESSCVVVPNDTDLKLLAPLGCGLQTGAGGVINKLRPKEDESIAIYGMGAVGTAALFAAAYLKVGTIIAVDLVDSRLEFALAHGATHAFNGRDPDLVSKIRDATVGIGSRYGVEATGNTRVLKSAWEALSNFGFLLSIGTPGPGHQPPFDIHEAVCNSKSYGGISEGDSNPPEFIPFLMKLYKEGKFPIDKITEFYPVERFDEAVHAMHSGAVIKPVITFD